MSPLARRSASGIVPAALIGPMYLDGRGRNRAWTLLQVPLFLAALFLVRALPALLYRSQLGMRRTMAAGFLQATSLPFIVAAVRIGQHLGVLPPASGATFIAAGLASVPFFPAIALAVMRTTAPSGAPTPASAPA